MYVGHCCCAVGRCAVCLLCLLDLGKAESTGNSLPSGGRTLSRVFLPIPLRNQISSYHVEFRVGVQLHADVRDGVRVRAGAAPVIWGQQVLVRE